MIRDRGLRTRPPAWLRPPRTAGEGDFCACGGTFVAGRWAGRKCGSCGRPEPEEEVPVRDLTGRIVWGRLSDLLARALR